MRQRVGNQAGVVGQREQGASRAGGRGRGQRRGPRVEGARGLQGATQGTTGLGAGPGTGAGTGHPPGAAPRHSEGSAHCQPRPGGAGMSKSPGGRGLPGGAPPDLAEPAAALQTLDLPAGRSYSGPVPRPEPRRPGFHRPFPRRRHSVHQNPGRPVGVPPTSAHPPPPAPDMLAAEGRRFTANLFTAPIPSTRGGLGGGARGRVGVSSGLCPTAWPCPSQGQRAGAKARPPGPEGRLGGAPSGAKPGVCGHCGGPGLRLREARGTPPVSGRLRSQEGSGDVPGGWGRAWP